METPPFALQVQDLRSHFRASQTRSVPYVLFMYGAGPALALAYVVFLASHGALWRLADSWAILALGFAAPAIPALQPHLMAILQARMAYFACERAVLLDEDGLTEATATTTLHVRWDGIEAIRETRHAVAFVRGRAGPLAMAVLVPKRLFPDGGHAFTARAHALWRPDHGGQPRPGASEAA